MKYSRILLFKIIFTVFLSINCVFAKTWTVDDDLQDYPEADYITIQQAIETASDGDSIIVYNGTYREEITINKKLTIKSNYTYSRPIMNVELLQRIYVESDDVLFDGFEIKGNIPYNGENMRITGNNVIIKNSIFKDNSFGVIGSSSNNVTIYNNTFINLKNKGLGFIIMTNSIVYGNTFIDSELSSSNCDNITITNNSFFDTTVWLNTHINSKFKMNNFCNSYLSLASSYYNIIDSNEFNCSSSIRTVFCEHNQFIFNFIGDSSKLTFGKDSLNNYFYGNSFMNYQLIDAQEVVDNIFFSNEIYHISYNDTTSSSKIGNYWHSYSGEDSNKDGILDAPFTHNLVLFEINDEFPLIGQYVDGVISVQENTISEQNDESNDDGITDSIINEEADSGVTEDNPSEIISELRNQNDELKAENEQLRMENDRLSNQTNSGIPSFPLESIILAIILFGFYLYPKK